MSLTVAYVTFHLSLRTCLHMSLYTCHSLHLSLYTCHPTHVTSSCILSMSQVHPSVVAKTAVTYLFGYFAGILEGTQNRINTRFDATRDWWLKNQFVYVKTKDSGKGLRLQCKNDADIGEKECCTIKLPIYRFTKKRPEREFDIIVVSAGDTVKLSTNALINFGKGKNVRMRFRKTLLGKNKATFCYEPLKYGKAQIRFEIVEACYLIGKPCQGIGGQEKKSMAMGRAQPNKMPPDDFTAPPPFTVMASPIPLSKIIVSFFSKFSEGFLSAFCRMTSSI